MPTLSPSPPFTLATSSASATRAQRRLLAGFTLVVLLAHWGLLGGLHSLLPTWQTESLLSGGHNTEAFITRTISLPAPVPVLAPAPVELKPASIAPVPVAPSGFSFEEISPLPPEPSNTPDSAVAPIAPVAAVAQLASVAPLAPMAVVTPVASAVVTPFAGPPPAPKSEDGQIAYGITGLADDGAPLAFVFPNPARLLYDVKGEIKGIPYSANAELLWKHDGKNYDARLKVSLWLVSRTQTSKGALTAQGLEPLRFGDKVRSEVAAHFEREKGKVSFSANTPDVPLTAGAQDQLSVFVQLAALLGGNPNRFTPGVLMSFQAIGPRSSENWVFKVGATETLKLPGGDVSGIKLVRDSLGENDAKAEIWLAPSLGYLPVRIRLTQGNSDFVDQLWRSTQIP